MTESKETKPEVPETQTETMREKITVYPEVCSYIDEEKEGYNINIYLPGVERETIELRMGDEFFTIYGESDRVKYRGSFGLCCPVMPDETVATYREGLLRVRVPFKEEFPTVNVRID